MVESFMSRILLKNSMISLTFENRCHEINVLTGFSVKIPLITCLSTT